MQHPTKSILLLVMSFSFLFVYSFYECLKSSIFHPNSKTPEPNNKTRHTGEANTLNNIEKVKNDLALAKSQTSQVKVLVLAYGRTGSSLTGDLISADITSAYFFEPLWYVVDRIGKAVIFFFLFYRNRSSLTTANSAESILNGIFNCSPKLLSEISVLQWPHGWPYVVLRRPGKCKTSNLRVIKTIRVRKEDLEPWILKSDIQARSER